MTFRTRHNQQACEPKPDPQLERLIQEAVASQRVPLDRQQRHLARIKRQGQASAAMDPWAASNREQRTMFADDFDPPRLPSSGQRGTSAMLPPTRTRRRQLTELTFGLIGFVVVAALLVALFRQEPEDSLGATDLTGTPTVTAAITPTPTTPPATTTLPAIDVPANTPLTETGPPDTPTPNETTASEPTPTSTGTVTLMNEQTLAGYGVLARWDAKVYNLAAMTVGPDDRVYAVDIDTGQASIYTLEETLVGRIDLTGGVPLVGERYDLAVDGDGTLYLLDNEAGRVYRYAADGSVLGDWDGSEAGAEALTNPLAIAIDGDGLLYISENLPDGLGRIRAFTTDGVEVAVWGNAGDEPLPPGIQALEVTNDAIYLLADYADRAAAIFRLDPDDGSTENVVRFTYSMDDNEKVMRSLAVDPTTGNLFAVDPLTNQVLGIRPYSGTFLYWSPDEVDDAIEREPNVHVAVDRRGYIYILQSERVLMTVLAPSEAVEEARQPGFGVSPRSGLCGDELTAHGGNFLTDDHVTILASIDGSNEFVEVGQATVVQEVGNPSAHFDAPISLEPLGVCEGEIDLDGVEITFVARAENDPKQADPASFTLFSASRVPTLTLTPAIGDCATSVTATGTGFVPGTTVTLMLGGHSPLPLAHGVAVDETGVFEVELSTAEFPECMRSPENPLTTEMTMFASTEWPTKQEPYPSAQATFTVTATD